MSLRLSIAAPCLAFAALAPCPAASRSAPFATAISYPMAAGRWEGEKTRFTPDEAFPAGLMTVIEGYAVLKDGAFGEGTIEVDIKALAYADTGILLNYRDKDTAEFVYVRANPACPAANDCVQYAPVINGRMQWNAYSRYQHAAPIVAAGWNHIRVVVANGRLRLFVNHSPDPSLDVVRLRGSADRGRIAVKGPAVFANLVVRPDDKGEFSPPPANVALPGVVHHWLLGPVTPATGKPMPTVADMPAGGWRPLDTEPDGLANLARAIPRNTTTGLQVAWLKVEIDANADCDKTIDLGFVPRAWLFLNGAAVFAGENFYYPANKRLTPAGRFAPDNARVKLRLRKGRNELVLATDDAWRRPDGTIVQDHYGWAGMVRFEDAAGLTLRPLQPSAHRSRAGPRVP